jgi:Acetoacetate decarboxylase (ADC)
MLVGTGDPELLARGAAELTGFATAPEKLLGVESLQIAFEADRAGADELLPPGLHPTRPPVVTWLVQRVPESPWGPFALAQCRIECRSGLRPRGFLRGAVIDNEAARAALAARWGYAAALGAPRLARSYDEIRASVALAGAIVLELALRDPMPLRTADAYYVASVHLAKTPRGLRLVQVDPDFDVARAERGRPLVLHFDAEAWRCPGLRPSAPVSGSFSIADVTLPSLRYACRPEVPAFLGTERVDTEA